jgi:hypothetical protein
MRQSASPQEAKKPSSCRFWELALDRYHPRDTLCPGLFEKLTPKSVVRKAGRSYPPTKGKAGGKLPSGKAALRSPARSFSEASRKAATNQA